MDYRCISRITTFLLLLLWGSLHAQTLLMSESFETDGEGTRYTSNHYLEVSPNCNFFERMAVSPLDICFQNNFFSNFQGNFFWGSEDIMRSGTPLPPGQITFPSININGYTGLNVSLFLATANNVTPTNTRWETADSINIQVSIDGGAYRTVGRFMGDNVVGGNLIKDNNLNGVADVGEPIVSVNPFTQYTFNFAQTGTTIQVRIDCDQIGGSEELGMDLIELRGTAPVCTPPSITCPSTQTLALNASCQASLPNYTSLAVVTGNCSPVTTQSPITGTTVSGVGTTTVTLTATNTLSQTASCNFSVNRVDNTVPAITCPANVSQANTTNTCARTVTYTAPTGTDNCTGASTTQTSGLASGASFPVGVTTNVFRVTDASGNTSTCSFTVTINDTQLPSITCPANVSQANSTGFCTATVTYSSPSGIDNCSGPITTQTSGLASGSAFPVGVTTNVFRVTDASGNTATCSFTVTITDTQVPAITCPANVSQTNTTGTCARTVTYTAPVGTDNCPAPTTTQTSGLASGASFPVGVTTNVFRVTDAAGNTTTCSFTVTITDTQLPAITCPGNQTVNAGSGACTATATYTAPVGTDNCSGPSTTQTAGLASGATFPAGTTTNTFRVTDASGNTATCSFTITIVDATAPSITCPSNSSSNAGTGTCAATVTYTTPVGTDNCAGPTTTQTAGLASGASFPVGVTTNTFRVTDASGNSTTCSFTVTVMDTEAPTITCPPAVATSNDPTACSAIVTYNAPSVSDNCSNPFLSQTFGLPSGSAFAIGSNINTFQVTDASGNTATCSFTVDVSDTELPTIACPSNVIATADPGACSTIVTYPSPTTSDNCGIAQVTVMTGSPSGSPFFTGATTVTLVASDFSSNVSTCAFIVTVNEFEPPTALCQGATVSLDQNGQGQVTTSNIDNGSSDLCGVIQLSLDVSNFDCTDLGANTVTLTVTDQSGNSATCTASVTVQDLLLPDITCLNDTLYLDAGTATLDLQAVTGTATDNCGTPTVTANPTTFSSSNIGANSVILTATDGSGNTATCTATVVVLDTVTSILEGQIPGITFLAAPSPFGNVLNIKVLCDGCEAGKTLTLQVWNMTGQRLHEESISPAQGGNLIRLTTAHFASGTYMVTLTDGASLLTRRLVKE